MPYLAKTHSSDKRAKNHTLKEEDDGHYSVRGLESVYQDCTNMRHTIIGMTVGLTYLPSFCMQYRMIASQ